NKLTKSLRVLVDGGPLWPLAEQFLEPRTCIYTYHKTSLFDEKSHTFDHPNYGSQKTLGELQNSDPSPRLGDSRQLEPKPAGQLALDSKSQSQDRYGRPFRPTGRTFLPRHRRPSRARKTNRPDASH